MSPFILILVIAVSSFLLFQFITADLRGDD
jgi:hypothetical protein